MKYLAFIFAFLFVSCQGNNHQPLILSDNRMLQNRGGSTEENTLDYQSVSNIFSSRCTTCHKAGGQFPNWDNKQETEKYLTVPENAKRAFWKITKDPRGGLSMPLEGTSQAQEITAEERRALAAYFSGANPLP